MVYLYVTLYVWESVCIQDWFHMVYGEKRSGVFGTPRLRIHLFVDMWANWYCMYMLGVGIGKKLLFSRIMFV